jgi:hypothetical protein
MDLKRRIHNLVAPLTGSGRPSREYYQEIQRKLIERLYFADFWAAEQATVMRDREVQQLVALKNGPSVGPGLACITRVPAPLHLGQGITGSTEDLVSRSMWALLTFVTQIDVASAIAKEKFARPLYLVLASGPAWVGGRSSVDLFVRHTITPAWAIVSSPTQGSFADRQQGLMRIVITASEECGERLQTKLASSQVFQLSSEPGPDPVGINLMALLERLTGSEDAPNSVHAVVLSEVEGEHRTLISTLSCTGDAESLLGNVEEIPDGSNIGPDLSPVIKELVAGMRKLLSAGFDVHLDSLESAVGSEVIQAELDVRFDSSIEVDSVWNDVEEAFGSDELSISELEAMPPLRGEASKDLGQIFEELDIPHTTEASSPAEAGLFVDADIPALLWGPGTPRGPNHVSMTGPALDLYAESLQELFERLLIRG